MPLPGVTIDEQRIVSSTGALSLTEVPKKMVVIGGGVIGLELGSVWARLGTAVTIVEYAPTLLNIMDDEARKAFQRTLTKMGMAFKFSTKVTSAAWDGTAVRVGTQPAAGGETETLDADVVLVAIGRRPHTASLGLADAGVATDKAGRVVVDMHTYATSAPGVFAIGDIIAGPMLAHKAEEEGIACVEQLAGQAGHVNYDTIPSIIYTHPEVAWVGKTEEQVKAAGTPYTVGKFPFMANSRARTNDDADGLVKIIAHKETNAILGAHIVGTSAGELLAEVVLAMEYGGSAEDIARTCHAHPTLSEAVKEAAMSAMAGGKVRQGNGVLASRPGLRVADAAHAPRRRRSTSNRARGGQRRRERERAARGAACQSMHAARVTSAAHAPSSAARVRTHAASGGLHACVVTTHAGRRQRSVRRAAASNGKRTANPGGPRRAARGAPAT